MFSANTIVSMKTIKYFKKSGNDVTLVFPGRSKDKVAYEEILKFYDIKEDIDILRTSYFLPFGKVNFFNKTSYIISHFVWSLFIYLKYRLKNDGLQEILYFTRSNWVFYFFSRKNLKIIFECHKYSKSTQLIFKLIGDKKSSGYIFQNSLLAESFVLSRTQRKNMIIIPSAYDEDDFMFKPVLKKDRAIVFIGRFTRFNEDRNLKFLINTFTNEKLKNFKLKLIGGPKYSADILRSEVAKNNISNIEILDYKPQNKLMKILSSNSIGILINSSRDIHSKQHTSPVKYFEYVRAGLKILAVDFEAHKLLPYSDQIYFFKDGDSKDLTEKILKAEKDNIKPYKNVESYSYSYRIEKINQLFARLEGFEPPTL